MEWYLWSLIGYVGLMLLVLVLIKTFTYQSWKSVLKHQWIFIFIQPIGIIWYCWIIFKIYVIEAKKSESERE